MLELPPVAPITGWRATTRLPRDHYVPLDSNDYAAHPAVVGRKVHITADLEQVAVTCDGAEVARHRRCWADRQTITDPAHADAAAEMPQARRLAAVPVIETAIEHRALSDYDRMFGLDSERVVA